MSAAAVVVVVLDLVLVPAFSSLGTPLWTYGYLHIVYEIFRYGGGLGASNPVWWMLVSLIGGLAAAVGLVVAIASHSRSGAAALVIGGLLVAIASGVSKLASPQVTMGPGVWGAVIGGSAVAFAGASLLVDHRGAGWTLSTISVLAAVGLAAAAFPVLHHSSQPPIDNAASQESPPTVAASPEATSPVSGFAPSSDTTETTTTYDTTTTALDPEASAAAQLQTIADSDQSQVEQLVNQWVPQLSSKKAGLVDPRDRWFPNVPYTNQLILRDFNNWQGEFGNVLLFDSSNYVSEIPGYWVTIVNQGYPDAQSVISWCQSQGLNDDDCGASLISHDVPSGNGTFVGW